MSIGAGEISILHALCALLAMSAESYVNCHIYLLLTVLLAVQSNFADIDDGVQYCMEEISVIPVDCPGCARRVGAELCANTSSWDKGKGDGSKEEATGDGEEKWLVERPT